MGVLELIAGCSILTCQNLNRRYDYIFLLPDCIMQGIVKFFNTEKGWGFITAQDVDYFIHYRHILTNGFKNLLEGQRVTFTPSTGERGAIAIEVALLSDLEDFGNC